MPTQTTIQQLLDLSAVHEEWKPLLTKALQTVDADYLGTLIKDKDWLPGPQKIFAAFQRDLTNCQYILFGESPYPRAASANGIAFYDADVTDLWSEKGLSKAVNKATSLRNIMKAALLADGLIQPASDGKIPQEMIARVDKQHLISSIAQLFSALEQKGFLLLNATPVLSEKRKPAIEARYWTTFIEQLLLEINQCSSKLPTLILWGKIAQQIESIAISNNFPKLISEHPYNISFITNRVIQKLFKELKFLQKD